MSSDSESAFVRAVSEDATDPSPLAAARAGRLLLAAIRMIVREELRAATPKRVAKRKQVTRG